MWAHPATQRNAAQAVADGAVLLGPAHGDQACGEIGDGRMLEALEIRDALIAFFTPKHLQGRKLLITAGPTFEPIDPVRGLTNLSSGKMGFAIARAAQEAGAEVTLVAGPVHLDTPAGVRRIDVRTAQQMHDAVLPLAGQHDIFVATAAVADWRPAGFSDAKIKKQADRAAPVRGLMWGLGRSAVVSGSISSARPFGCSGPKRFLVKLNTRKSPILESCRTTSA
jgi:phosphopantothenoylcysteine decarboxylase/phosphopantothenate--cysteine ligase